MTIIAFEWQPSGRQPSVDARYFAPKATVRNFESFRARQFLFVLHRDARTQANTVARCHSRE
ncbi:MAG TPA: hypothetical protein VMT08_34580 [Bradyrhizobium sp.]|nr:hypothetical protein [Bradyrhizobium sp.]